MTASAQSPRYRQQTQSRRRPPARAPDPTTTFTPHPPRTIRPLPQRYAVPDARSYCVLAPGTVRRDVTSTA